MKRKNETPKQWAERIAKVFGKKQPRGIELRGSGKGISYNFDEIRLVDNYRRCKIEYEKLRLKDEPKTREHLESQQRVIYSFAYGFGIDIEPDMSTPLGRYDFIPWPEYAESYYTSGLADKIFVTEWHDLPYLLDFQFFNHVRAQKFDEVRFLQLLKHEVRHYLAQRGQVVERKLDYLNDWLYRHVSNLDADGEKKFFWYSDVFEWKENVSESEQGQREFVDEDFLGHPQSITEGVANNQSPLAPELDTKQSNIEGLRNPAPFRFSGRKEDLIAYFDLLKQKNPSNDRPILNPDGVDWIVGYYFGDTGYHHNNNKPLFDANFFPNEMKFFIHQLYEKFFDKKVYGSKSGVPLFRLVEIMTKCFPDIFTATKATSYSTKMAQYRLESSPVIELLRWSTS
jgi:hypothetical protein